MKKSIIMHSYIKHFILITFYLLVFSCTNKDKIIENTNDRINYEFNEWKKLALKNGYLIDYCITSEELEAIQDTAKYNRLQGSYFFPNKYTVSFGDFNNDDKIDALYSFSSYTCDIKSELTVRSIPGIQPDRILVLIKSDGDGYTVVENIINHNKVEQQIQKKLKAIKVAVYINEIYDENILTGVCKIWSSDGSQGLCCPDKLYQITIDTKEKKIWLHINNYENQAQYELTY